MINALSVRRRAAVAAVLAAIALPPALQAQARTQVTPFFTTFFAPLPYGKDIAQGGGITADERLTTAPGVGLRFEVRLANSIGFEGQGAAVFAGRQATVNSGGTSVGFFIKGNAIMLSGRFAYHPRRSNFRGIVGFGWQKLGGDAWNESNFSGASFNKSSVGGVVGFGVRANVTPRLPLDLTVESFLHSSDPAGYGSKEFQADIMLSVGVPIGLGSP